MRRKDFFGVALMLAVSLATTGLLAQGPPGGGRGGRGGRGGPKAGATVEKIRLLKPNLYMITGGGANTLVRVTPEGLIVVDTKNPGDENYNRVMEEIQSVSDLPVKYVLNTHHHPGPRRQQSEVHRRGRDGHRLGRSENRHGQRSPDQRYPGAADPDFRERLCLEIRRRRSRGAFLRTRAHRRRHHGVLPRSESSHGQRSDHGHKPHRRFRQWRQRRRMDQESSTAS